MKSYEIIGNAQPRQLTLEYMAPQQPPTGARGCLACCGDPSPAGPQFVVKDTSTIINHGCPMVQYTSTIFNHEVTFTKRKAHWILGIPAADKRSRSKATIHA